MAESKSSRINQVNRITHWSIFWNIILSIFKLTVGFIGKSNALLADGVHSFSDLISDFIVLGGVRMAERPQDQTHHYGHGKFETLSALILALFLLLAALAILYEGAFSIYSFYKGHYLSSPSMSALFIALIAIVIKEILFRYTIRIGKQQNSPALVANAWHHRTDAYSSVAASIGIAGALFLGPKWRILDPVAAILVSLLILRFAIPSFKDSLNELLEASLDSKTNQQILDIAGKVAGVLNPHNLHTRKIGNSIAIEMHINVRPSLTIVEAHDISTALEKTLKENFGENAFISIHVEPDEAAE